MCTMGCAPLRFFNILYLSKKKRSRLLLNLPMYPKRDGLVGQGSYKEFS
jgi:hypothetical protein